ncbi:MAG: hypothetical protein L0Y61_01815 [Epsilonproteobacteria bacterium]|nr:hypothetical protein [Campylobacterota bacterium]
MQEITLEGATVPFYKETIGGVANYTFDSSRCGHPEPMINAMVGLQTIKDNEKLIMINSKAPAGLFPKVENDFNYGVEELENGKFKITFTKKGDGSSTNFDDRGCGGGCSH